MSFGNNRYMKKIKIKKIIDKAFDLYMPQEYEEILGLAHFVHKINPKIVVEIGTKNGGTFMIWNEVTKAKTISIDLIQGIHGGVNEEKTLKRNNFFKELYGNRCTFIGGNSHDLLTLNTLKEKLDGDFIDFLFIDGDHTYEGVKQDFEMYKHLVKPNGWVAFHDINDTERHRKRNVFVGQLWNELKGNKKPEVQSNLKRDLQELWVGIQKNTFLHVLFVIFALLMSAYVVFGTLFSVGVDQGYQPVQPIVFSHKIHAGDNKIDCQYCHSSAKHSKHSGIPSVNVCMNCHKSIAEVADDTVVVLEDRTLEKAELDKEIAKVYRAAGWDADKLEYTGDTKPIKWVRIHNLPDFVYFNHSQHVTVAGVQCQKCHGPVEEMEEMYQHSPLTMGWCIDCHRETDVDLKGNEYYAKIHEQLAKKYGVEKVTAAQLGGLECGKCHY